MQNIRILVVDDNALIINLIRFAVRDLPVHVFGASSGTKALIILLQQPFHLVITDLVMPGMTGCELIRQCRQLPQYGTIPIIAISGYDEQSGAREARAAGAVHFIPKPFTAADITACVCALLRNHLPRHARYRPARALPARNPKKPSC